MVQKPDVLSKPQPQRTCSMPVAPDIGPKYWHQRAKEARRLAERMIDERAKQTMLRVAEHCDRFAIRAAIYSIEEL